MLARKEGKRVEGGKGVGAVVVGVNQNNRDGILKQ